MKQFIFTLLMFLGFSAIAQQINIPRVDEMPDFPQPYLMRDWQAVAQGYDSLVFDLDAAGAYFPLASIFENTVNYPEHPALAIQSYVGTNSPPGKEAINVLPAVIGATLSGIDKSNQNGMNWALYCEEYFNRRPAENVYLNGPQSSSGNDWWYETMPNVFFYQLNDLYPNTGDFNYQLTTVADRWLEAVYALGGNTAPWEVPYMNYRAFNLSTMTPREDGVKQPEAAGAIAWILYQAYQVTGEHKYRIGAELALEFLSQWEQNPSYEIQLPYGVYAAARMNAELGTGYDINKMLNWCFDRGDLRGWGVITGDWNGLDMDGLIGEVNAGQPDYVFNMNSLEHVGALVPMTRYDDRYATAIGKWVLNVANASRFYYSQYLPEDMQDNFDWSEQYDPGSVIAYESLREKDDGPFGTGDAMGGGWAETNLGLYGSSHVGIFGGIIRETNVEGVLQLDLLATDYYRNEAYQTYLYYNPHNASAQVEISFVGNKDIYDAIANQMVATGMAGSAIIEIPAGQAVMAVLLPENSSISYHLNTAYVDGIVIDYNTEQTVVNYPPRIKALAAEDTVAVMGETFSFYCTAEDPESTELNYSWTVDEVAVEGDEVLSWKVPEIEGFHKVKCTVTDGGDLTAGDSLMIKVVETINYPPVIEQLIAEDQVIDFAASTSITCTASDGNGDELSYNWSTSLGTLEGSGNTVTFLAPGELASLYVVCEVKDIHNSSVKDSVLILVRDENYSQTGDLVARYLFSGNAADATGNGFDGSITDCIFVDDMFGTSDDAIKLNISTSKVTVGNDDALNFRDGLTISYWINISEMFDREAYPVSHGNWTTRWKTSITGKRIRFTLNGTGGIVDVDSEKELETDTWYHVVALYNGMDCLVFIDGELEGFLPYSGLMNTTTYDLVFGQSLPDQLGFNFKGMLDNLRIYNYGISYQEMKEIYEGELSDITTYPTTGNLKVFPNPAKDQIYFVLDAPPNDGVGVTIYSMAGQRMFEGDFVAGGQGQVHQRIGTSDFPPGTYIFKYTIGTKTQNRKIIILE